MKKILPYTLASIILLGGASTTIPTEVSAAPSYKIVKNKLVHSKTGKAVKGPVLYKKKLYTNGKVTTKTTVYKKQLFQKGKLASGKVVYKNTLYLTLPPINEWGSKVHQISPLLSHQPQKNRLGTT